MRCRMIAHYLLLTLALTALSALRAWPARANELPPASVVYVAPDGDDARDCASPATRCATVEHALEMLAEGGEARLATGVYTGTTDLKRSVLISGGYSLPDYLPNGGSTVLDGQQLGTTLRIAEPIWVRLAQLSITGGLADGAGQSTGRGGGLYIRGAKVLLDHVLVNNNIADIGGSGRGGGIYIRDGSLTLTSSIVTSNTATLLVASSSITRDPALAPLVLNATGSGGGIYAQDARVAIQQSVVSENHAVAAEEGLTATRSWGGGIYAVGCILDTVTTVFRDNDTLGVVGSGGAIKLLSSQARLRGGEISGNQAADDQTRASTGGAIDIYAGRTTIDNLALHGYHATNDGILLQPAATVSPTAALTLTNVLLADHIGTALALLPNGQGTAYAELRHTTVISNGVGVLASAGQTVHIANSLLVQNDIGTRSLNGTIALRYTDRYDNRLDADGEVLLGPLGDLALPPGFVEGDPLYHLAPESLLIDQGVPVPGIATDFEGQARSADGDGDGRARPDLGWDELARSAAQFGSDKTLYALPGQTITTTLELRNVGAAADIFELDITAPTGWSASVTPTMITLGPKTRISLAISIGIPAEIPLNSMEVVTIQATGRTSAAVGRIFVGVGEP
jgi:hypothetical protein